MNTKLNGSRQESSITIIQVEEFCKLTFSTSQPTLRTGDVDGFMNAVANIKQEYRQLNRAIYDLATELMGHHRTWADGVERHLIPLRNQMQMLLSRRGKFHSLAMGGQWPFNKIEPLKELPSWTKWFEAFRAGKALSMSLRSVQR